MHFEMSKVTDQNGAGIRMQSNRPLRAALR
jgi:hypothetical protein